MAPCPQSVTTEENPEKTPIHGEKYIDSGFNTEVSSACSADEENPPVDYACDIGLDETLDSLPVPPDGGWGWVVCFASFTIMVILDGMMFTFGVFFIDLLESFHESKGKTAMVGSALMGGHLIAGPFTSAMVNLWGIRRVALAGSLFACVSFIGSTLAPSVNVLIFTYGILGGIGTSMVYLPAILIVGFYFHRRRALANGIGNSGSGIGTFVFAPLSQALLDEYTWRGALLILAGLVLNCAAMSALFRPLEKRPARKRYPSSSGSSGDAVVDSHCLLHKQVKHLKEWEVNVSKLSQSHGDLPTSLFLSPVLQRHWVSSHQLPEPNLSSEVKNQLPVQYRGLSHPNLKPQSNVNCLEGVPAHLVKSGAIMNKPLYRKDAFYSGSIWRLPEAVTSPSIHSFQASMLRLEEQDFLKDSEGKTRKRSYFTDSLRQMIDFRLLKEPVFLMCIASGVLWTTHSTVLSILPDYATLSGNSKTQASILLSVIGTANVVGRLLAGFLADRPGIDSIWVNTAALFTGGLINILVPFTSAFPILAAEAFIFGLSMATWTSLRPIILVDLLGVDRLTNAFGLMVMFQGVAFCVGPPIAGTLFDMTGSYTVPFLVAGSALTISALISLLKRRVARCHPSHISNLPEINISVQDIN